MDLPVRDISHEWNHTGCGLLRLALFTVHRVFKNYLYGSMNQTLIPFQGQASPVSVCASVGRHLGSLAGVGSAAINTRVRVFLGPYVLVPPVCRTTSGNGGSHSNRVQLFKKLPD